jgi:hypothetical protein
VSDKGGAEGDILISEEGHNARRVKELKKKIGYKPRRYEIT